MTYRVTMIEVEILRLWLVGVPKRRIALTVGVDRKTVRSYIEVACEFGLAPGPQGMEALRCWQRWLQRHEAASIPLLIPGKPAESLKLLS
jgi:hypothetical protein